MDKYEYNLKLEEIDKLVDQGDYQEAAKLADTIDWRRVRNIRTLCLISEIYEASGRLEDSKGILVRAYKRSPVGRTVLYRLVEVTTALRQYDEAIEYYTEYVQAAPHDNNRYILKYKIYKGRGSSVEELIAILEEYLGQEYTERWAYELATLYQQSGQMQKCFAACDDLVLWFHSGKYVIKALELKKKYAALTPKQQQIYEECLEEQMQDDLAEAEQEETVMQNVESTDGEVIAESIMAETEKEIADQVSAHKAELDKVSQNDAPEEDAADISRTKEYTRPGTSGAGPEGSGDLQVELAKSMRKIISGVVKLNDEPEDDIPASVDPGMSQAPRMEIPKPRERAAAQLSIDDILLSMGDKGKKIVDTVLGEEDAPEDIRAKAQSVSGNSGTAAAEAEKTGQGPAGQGDAGAVMPGKNDEPAAAEEQRKAADTEPAAAEEQRKAADTENAAAGPQEKTDADGGQTAVRESAEAGTVQAVTRGNAEAGTRQAVTRGNAEAGTVQAVTRGNAETGTVQAVTRGNAETGAGQTAPRMNMTEAAAEDLTDSQREALQYTSNPERLLRNKSALPTYFEEPEKADDSDRNDMAEDGRKDLVEAVRQDVLSGKTIRIPTEKISRGAQSGQGILQETPEGMDSTGVMADAAQDPADGLQEAQEPQDGQENPAELREPVQDSEGMEGTGEDAGYTEDEEEYEYLTIPQYLRGLFNGFTEVEGLEDQIANAILQAEAKGADRTSRNGNILIFGAHGSGKTTLAMALAKAIAQDRGSQTMKIARIYAADLNRKDIAATIAKIAGGTLIVEEAGDLEPDTVEQLTTAMEFRTDGMIMILEDEQQYIHEMLMRHPRFTMKFTAQIYLPEYTVEELTVFGRIYANAQDYVISEEACDTFCQIISAGNPDGSGMTISDVTAVVDRAIARSGKFFRKISMGKKRYDENDYVILFPKDFK